MSELKPCPFCGGEVEAVKSEYPRLTRPTRNGWHVVCWNCDLLFGYDTDYAGEYDTPDQAIDAWNTRAERTCRMVDAYCDQCGKPDPSNGDAKYCAYCGARVVG